VLVKMFDDLTVFPVHHLCETKVVMVDCIVIFVAVMILY
jgi:hypothetical protein